MKTVINDCSWFYDIGARDFADKLRERCQVPHAKEVDPEQLERVMPILVAARPFFMFPGSFSPTDIRDLEAALPEEDGHIVGRITELFHPDMNYSNIENAIRELLNLHTSLRWATGGRPQWITNMVDWCSSALWCGRKTQLEMDENHELTEAAQTAGVSGRPGNLASDPVNSDVQRALCEPTLERALSLVATSASNRAQRQGRDWLRPEIETTFERVLMEWERLYGKREQPGMPVNSSVIPDPMPVPMLLYCPMCHTKHVDEGEFATRSHHTHACQGRSSDGRRCGHVWRPAIVPTVGVEALPGFINETAPSGAALVGLRARLKVQGSWIGAEVTGFEPGDKLAWYQLRTKDNRYRVTREDFELT